MQINEQTEVPEWLFVLFAVCTTVLVAVHIFALMISTYILPNIDAIAKLEICEIVAESPHERLRNLIELAWAFSTILGTHNNNDNIKFHTDSLFLFRFIPIFGGSCHCLLGKILGLFLYSRIGCNCHCCTSFNCVCIVCCVLLSFVSCIQV